MRGQSWSVVLEPSGNTGELCLRFARTHTHTHTSIHNQWTIITLSCALHWEQGSGTGPEIQSQGTDVFTWKTGHIIPNWDNSDYVCMQSWIQWFSRDLALFSVFMANNATMYGIRLYQLEVLHINFIVLNNYLIMIMYIFACDLHICLHQVARAINNEIKAKPIRK